MSESEHTDAEQTSKQTLMNRVADVPWTRFAYITLAAIIGLTANSVVLLLVVGGDAFGIADGVAYLAVPVIMGAWVHDRYNPARGTPYIGPAVLFLTLMGANLISLTVKVFRMGGQSNPVMSVVILAFLSLLFTPGAFLAVWGTRKWVLD